MPEYDPLADLYDMEYDHDYDLPFWLSLAGGEKGPVIEWGAGTGRLSGPLSEMGLDVTAVEVSGALVRRGREKYEGVEWVRGDMRRARLGRRYGFAICAFNSFLCLTSPDAALAFLRNVRAHLSPGGLLGIEVSAFSPEELSEPPGGPHLRHDLTRELPQGTLERFSVSGYDAASQTLSMRLFYELYSVTGTLESRRSHELEIRVTNRDELSLMLRLAGFEEEPFTAGSDHLVVLARPTAHGPEETSR